MKRAAFALTIFLLMGAASAQPSQMGYLRADSAQFRVFFQSQDAGTYRALWPQLQAGLVRLQMSLGIPLKDTVTYIITPNRDEWHRITGGIPDWSQGISDPYHRMTILKSPRFGDPMHPFYVTAVHELVHLLLHGDHPDIYIPRWLDEGLAQILSGESLQLQTGLISQAVLSNRIHSFYQIEMMMSMPAQEARQAYAESVTAVDLLIKNYGWSGVRNYVAALETGLEPDQAFIKTFGIHLGEFEAQWFDYLRKTYRFTFFQNWEFYLGVLFLPFLALAGFAAWRRRRKILQQWEVEERGYTIGSTSDYYPPPDDYAQSDD